MKKIKLIAETAWHHDGDYKFMERLVNDILQKTKLDALKMHIILDVDEYMNLSHTTYNDTKNKMFSEELWSDLIKQVKNNDKDLMLLYNDTKAIEFGAQFEPPLVEIHSVCLNDIFLLDVLKNNIRSNTVVVLGVGGLTLDEIEFAINRIQHQKIILMFGFQNFPTQYENINFNKMQRIMKLFPEYSFGYADHTAWDEPNNILITLLGAALGVDVVEKHVTNFYGEERLDWNSAVSIQMFNEIADKLSILSKCNGDGLIKLNEGEEKYSIYGPMKKAAVLSEDVKKGEILNLGKIKFQRTKETTDLSQLETIKRLGYQIVSDLNAGTVLFRKHLQK